MTAELETLQAIAERLGMAPKTLYVYRQRYAEFPEPAGQFGRFALYDAATVTEWLKKKHRGPQEPHA